MKKKITRFVKSIPWYVWLTSLLFSLIYAFYYKLYATYVPQGWVWVGGVGGDDSVYLGLMQFVVNQPWSQIFGAESPWHMLSDPGSHKILLIPEFSSPYWFYFLGILAKLLKIAPATFMILTRVGLSFLLPLSVWWFLSSLGVKGGKWGKGRGSAVLQKRLSPRVLAFLFYFFSFGLGGLYFLLFSFFKEGRFNLIPFWPFTAMGNAVTYELFEGVGLHPLDFLGRTYYVAGIILGLLSLALLARAAERARRIRHRIYWGLLGGLCLAISQCIYPITGVGFVGLAFLWLGVFKREHFEAQLAQLLNKSYTTHKTYMAKVLAHLGIIAFFSVAALGGLPWFASLLADKTHFVTYGQLKVNATPLPLLVSTATLLVPAVLYVIRRVMGVKGYKMVFWGLLAVEVVLLSVNVFPLRTVLIYVVGGLLAMISFFAWDKKEKAGLFFWLWFLLAFFASIMPIRDWTPFLPARFMLLLWLPLSVLGGFAFLGVKGGKGWIKLLLVLATLLSTPSPFFYSAWFLRKPLRPEVYAQSRGDGGESLRPEYITTEEFEALQFLQSQPQGVVLAPYELGMYLPLLSNHKSLLGRDPMIFDFGEKATRVNSFLSGEEAGKVLSRYNIDYVLSPALSFPPQDFLELMAQFGEVKVWKVK
ncbi:MAG: hypothetical protein ABH814_00505 [bacterium]